MTGSTSVMGMSRTSIQQCKICGAPAVFTNFGVLSCSSCKMFFKRNAEVKQVSFKCDFDNQCEINSCNRRICSACRLVKCFTSGMLIELIRGSRTRKNRKRQQKKMETGSTIGSGSTELQLLPTLNLLKSDQSTLTYDQWNLLSNVIHCYDEHSGLTMAQLFLIEQNSFPIRLRYKHGSVGKLITSNMNCLQRILSKNNDYRSLRIEDRSALLRNTVKHTGCIGTTFVLHQARLLDDPLFYQSSESIFGANVMSTIIPMTETFDSDDRLVKLFITIVAFSTTKYTIYPDITVTNLIDLRTIIRIQDSYVELTWRYMIYKYSYEQAVIRFCSLIRNLFRVHCTIVEAVRVQEYSDIIETVVEQAEQKLTLND